MHRRTSKRTLANNGMAEPDSASYRSSKCSLRRKKRNQPKTPKLLPYFAALCAMALALWGLTASQTVSSTSIIGADQRELVGDNKNAVVNANSAHYRQVREAALQHGLYTNPEASQKQHLNTRKRNNLGVAKRRAGVLGSAYGANVSSCELTVLYFDPRLADPNYRAGEAGWYALESVGAYASNTCVVLLTSHCNAAETEDSVRDRVYGKALPLFRNMVDRGLVRLSFLDYQKYGLQSCQDYGNPTSALISYAFWRDEFLDGIDSETILYIQDDAVLCRPLDVAFFKSFAYVGSVWPRNSNSMMPFPPQGMCEFMPHLWNSWIRPERKRLQTLQEEEQGKTWTQQEMQAAARLPLELPTICENGIGPVGNGGLSMRNRTWLMRAIETCPHAKYSGLEESKMNQQPCKVFEFVNEDLYYGIVLRGMGAPLPKAIESSLFSAELLWPERVMREYPDQHYDNNNILQRMSQAPKVMFEGSEQLTLPYGLHKAWYYSPNSLLLSDEMKQKCTYLQYIFQPNMTKWHDINADFLRPSTSKN